MTFGERLIDLRKTRKYTREALAEELNISKYTLRNYELSVNEPGSSFLKQVSDFFDVSIDYLMGMTNEKEKIRPYNLKASEYAHIEKYRSLDPHGKDMVDTVLDKEYARCESIKKAEVIQLADCSYLDPEAAHDRTDIDVTPDMVKKDDDIMDNDDEWK